MLLIEMSLLKSVAVARTFCVLKISFIRPTCTSQASLLEDRQKYLSVKIPKLAIITTLLFTFEVFTLRATLKKARDFSLNRK